MIKAICYISNKKTKLSKDELETLMDIVVLNNKRLNITGILIYQNNHFFQIMEGDEQTVNDTYKKIKVDRRHSGIIQILETELEDRVFDAYDSGEFAVIRDYSKLKKLRIYFDWIKEANILAVDELIELTTNFVKNNK